MGGGISCWESSPAFFANVVSGNVGGDSLTPGQGGGFYLYDFGGILAGNQVMGNRSPSGGGVYFVTSGSPPGPEADFSLNRIAGNTARLGAGLFLHGDHAPSLLMNTIRDNVADSLGGGLFLSGGSSPVLGGNNIMRNVATGAGGGAYVSGPGTDPAFGGSGMGGGLTNTFQANEALLGGAICYTDQANPTGAHGMYYGNEALRGGAIYCDAPAGTFEENTFDWNKAWQNGGAIFVPQGMSPVLRRNTFTRNIGGAWAGAKGRSPEAGKAGNGNGGALYVGGDGANPLITQNLFQWNVSHTGHGGGPS
ncbi:MAG TPA: right-handed parallel beta-helix repeat-containing protein, partial [Bacteroidales bacterium]|nr:right-handed parallel beta-helix repeat-containing protein [Bacteroidales bacterium]